MGRVYDPSKESINTWEYSHASVPIAVNIGGDLFRIYFSTRDSGNKSYTTYVEMNIGSPRDIISHADKPVLVPGQLGEFDDSGAMGSWITEVDGKYYLYYIGWNLSTTVPFRNSIGLALSDDGIKFSRASNGPLLDRNFNEPHFTASSCVIFDNGVWRMWYLSCTEWILHAGKPSHKYHIKYAESDDGLSWLRKGIVAIDYSNEKEYAISRPSVIKHNGYWHMWYSYRGDKYRIGYATSIDGIMWQRLDDSVGIDVSNEGWDSEMIEYPFVFKHKEDIYMLYNGNGYGKTGFGLAKLGAGL